MNNFLKKNTLFRLAILFFIISTTISSYASNGKLANAFLYCLKNVKWQHLNTNVTKNSRFCAPYKFKIENLNYPEIKNRLITNDHFNDTARKNCEGHHKKAHIQRLIKNPVVKLLSKTISIKNVMPSFIECGRFSMKCDSIADNNLIVDFRSKMNILAKEYGNFNEINNHDIANLINFINKLNHNEIINIPHKHESIYETQLGGLIDFSQVAGVIRTGSEPHGGIEPSFIIDLKSPLMVKFLKKMQPFSKLEKNQGEKMLSIIKEMNKHIRHTPYNDLMLALMFHLAHSIDKNTAIPLSFTLGLKVADCRNHASLLNIASRYLGIASYYGYFKVSSPNSPSEDHAMVVAEMENPKTGEIEPYIFDSYFSIFNGKPLRLLKEGIDHRTDSSEFITGVPALKEGTFAKILSDSLSYPAYKIPQN